jgi:ribonuclease BN (tRNA processing enzyme)
MRLTVLGGSAAGPNAGAGCSGYLVHDGDSAVVIDLGPGTVPELKKHVDLHAIDAIVVSHAHLDHVLDLATLRYALKYAPNGQRPPLPLWVPPGTMETLTLLAHAFASDEEIQSFYSGVFDIRTFEPDESLAIGSLAFTFAPAVHYVPAWAMRVQASRGVLGYTADTGPSAHLEDLLHEVDVLLAEATLLEAGPEPISTRGHLTAREAGVLARAVGAKTLLLTHIWEELGFERIREYAAQAFAGRIEVARPGLIIDF